MRSPHPEELELQPSTQDNQRHALTMNEYDDGASGSMSIGEAEIDRRTVRKLDYTLLPFLALLFLFNSLDKSNIGNAETAHFTSDIGLEPEDLNTSVAVFFAFFVTLQPVGAALGRRYGMRTFVPACMTIWGICTALHVWVRAKWQLILLRMMIGCLEAGFYPTTVSYISMFYTRFEFGRRLSAFYGQLAVAGAIGGVLSYFVFSRFKDHTDSKWKPWQVLFLLEGCMTIVLAMIGFLWLPNNAGTAWFLSPAERRWAEERINRDRNVIGSTPFSKANDADLDEEDAEVHTSLTDEAHDRLLSASNAYNSTSSVRRDTATSSAQGLTRTDILSAVLDWKIWYLLACNVLSAIPVTAFSVFLPLVLAPITSPSQSRPSAQDSSKSFSARVNDPALVNLLSAPPFLLGAVTLFMFSSWSDRLRNRLQLILIGLSMLSAGLILILCLPNSWVSLRYLSLCILLAGSFIPSPLTVAWISGNMPSPGKRAIVLGLNGWGNIAGVISSAFFAPRYAVDGYKVSLMWTLGAVLLAATGFAIFRVLLIRENRSRVAWSRKVGAREIDMETKYGNGRWSGRGVLGWNLDYFPMLRHIDVWVKKSRKSDGVDGREGDERFTFTYGL